LVIFHKKLQLQETNSPWLWEDRLNNFDYESITKNFILRPSQPLKSNTAYRMVVSYSYRGAFEQKVCSWGEEHARILVCFLPAWRNGVTKSDWFVVKPEASGTNKEH
jgi:hypothetical protein